MTEHWNGGNGGKGSKPRPFNISADEYEKNMTRIFGDKDSERKEKQKEKQEYFARLAAETKARMENNVTSKNEYYDTLSTEDCLTED
jgi:hypothetical protein